MYVDDRNNEYEINSNEGWIKARIKLLPEAESGNWLVNAYVKNKNGINSKLYNEHIPLENVTGVEFALEASVIDNIVQLTWQSSSTANFEIERRQEKRQFQKIGSVIGSGIKQNYQFLDKSTGGGKYYYRIKQLNTDGTYKYSPIIG